MVVFRLLGGGGCSYFLREYQEEAQQTKVAKYFANIRLQRERGPHLQMARETYFSPHPSSIVGLSYYSHTSYALNLVYNKFLKGH